MKDLLSSAIDLSIATVSEPSSGVLSVSTRMTPARVSLAIILGAVALGFLAHCWVHRSHLWMVVWPNAVVIPVFGLASLFLAFGYHQKKFDTARRVLSLEGHVGPLSLKNQFVLPAQGKIAVTERLEYPSSATKTPRNPTRWYDVSVIGLPAACFTIATDRDAALSFAERLGRHLGFPVEDHTRKEKRAGF